MLSIHEGGWAMYPMLAVGILLIGVAITYAYRPLPEKRTLLFGLGALTLLLGATGFVFGVMASLRAVELPPDQRYLVWVGLRESLNNVALALLLATVGVVALVIGGTRRT
jgi:hypothetical protein